MKLLIDLQPCQGASGERGIGRYALSIAEAILRIAGHKHDIHFLLNSIESKNIELLKNKLLNLTNSSNIHFYHSLPSIAMINPDNSWNSHATNIIREYYISELNVDAVLNTSLFEGYLDNISTSIKETHQSYLDCVILYDLIPLQDPINYLPTDNDKNWYRLKIDSLKRADICFSISKYTKEQAQKLLELDSHKIIHISSAADSFFQPTKYPEQYSKNIFAHYNIKKPFILSSGNLDSRKNLETLIKAYGLIPSELRRNYQLVIICPQNPTSTLHFQHQIKSVGLELSEVILTGRVSDDDLLFLYNKCELFIFPSLAEGFGLPILEAMQCGAAVICSNTTSLPEVIEHSNATFNPKLPTTIAEKLIEVLTNKLLLEQLREHGLIKAKNFSWDITASRLIDALELRLKKEKHSNKENKKTNIFQSQHPNHLDFLKHFKAININEKDLALTNTHFHQLSLAIYRNSFELFYHNDIHSKPNQLFIDISRLAHTDAKTGIQRVVRSILAELLNKNIDTYAIRPVYNKNGQYFYAEEFTSKFSSLPSNLKNDFPISYKAGDILIGLDLDADHIPSLAEYLKELRNQDVWICFIIYDLLPLLHPEWFPPQAYPIYQNWMRVITEHAHCLTCISQAVAVELNTYIKQNHLKHDPNFIINSFHLGADIENSIPTTGLSTNASAIFASLTKRPSILMVGTVEIRKGHAQAIAAFEELWAKHIEVNLVIVGKPGWYVDTVINQLKHHPEKDNRLYWLSSCSDEMLIQLYQKCTALLVASEGEGFGLPLIEAAKHGLPILARDLPVFREVAEQHAFYFRANTAQGLAEAIKQWLQLNTKGIAPSSKQLKYLNWQESSQQLLASALPPKIAYLFIDISMLLKIPEQFLTAEIKETILKVLNEITHRLAISRIIRPAYIFRNTQNSWESAESYLNQKFQTNLESKTTLPTENDFITLLDFPESIKKLVNQLIRIAQEEEETFILTRLSTRGQYIFNDLKIYTSKYKQSDFFALNNKENKVCVL